MSGGGKWRTFLTAMTMLISGCGLSPASVPSLSAEPLSPLLAYGFDGDIFLDDSDGSNPVRIADGRAADKWGQGVVIEKNCGPGEYFGEGPMWSPDGRYLAYRHTNCEAPQDTWWDVVIIDPKGNVVTSFPGQGWQISWSPDSSRVAIWVTWVETIGVYGLDGVRQALLTVPPDLRERNGEGDPVWSPDGASLVLPNAGQIFLDGSLSGRLPWFDDGLGWWAYTSDGARVAYVANQSLVVASSDGSHVQEVFERWVSHPVWSPKGDSLAFATEPGGTLQLLDLATGSVTMLAEKEESEWLWLIEYSPDGDRILFSATADEGAGTSSLWSIKTDGSDRRALVAGARWGDWRP